MTVASLIYKKERGLTMTNINCIKECRYQNEGKCSLDSILFTFENDLSKNASECPYQVKEEKRKENDSPSYL